MTDAWLGIICVAFVASADFRTNSESKRTGRVVSVLGIVTPAFGVEEKHSANVDVDFDTGTCGNVCIGHSW